jgi:hypothetical protein
MPARQGNRRGQYPWNSIKNLASLLGLSTYETGKGAGLPNRWLIKNQGLE